jgi:hypothetical protein
MLRIINFGDPSEDSLTRRPRRKDPVSVLGIADSATGQSGILDWPESGRVDPGVTRIRAPKSVVLGRLIAKTFSFAGKINPKSKIQNPKSDLARQLAIAHP